MKYAFIIMIAFYLVTAYGCSPDNSKKTSDNHDKTVQISMDQQHQNDDTDSEITIDHQTAVTEPATEVKEQQAEEAVVVPEQITATVADEARATEAEQTVTMPCGRTLTKAELTDQAPPPCAQDLDRATQVESEPQTDVSAALHKMVEATNDMVMVTRQLVIATQEMIDASQGVTAEINDEQQPQN